MDVTFTEALSTLQDYVQKGAEGDTDNDNVALKELVLPYLSVTMDQIIKSPSPSSSTLSLSNLEILQISSQPKFKMNTIFIDSK